MTEPALTSPPRPQLALRVGVTGTRALPQEAKILAALTGQLDAVLDLIRAAALTIANPGEDTGGKAPGLAYAADDDGTRRPLLRILSPLAEGADRLVARHALERGFRLDVAMPFAQADYEQDFIGEGAAPGSLEEFRSLLAEAATGEPDGRPRVLELDGARGPNESASYGAVGRFVVRNSDLVIAIWDGRPGKGPGGTADTVRYAARLGVPVWWLTPGGEPAFVTSYAQLRRPELRASLGPAAARLSAYLVHLLTPPPAEPEHEAGLLARLFAAEADPLKRFLSERLPLGTPRLAWLWRSERRVMAFALHAGAALDRSLAMLFDRGRSTHSGPHPEPDAEEALPPQERREAAPPNMSTLPGAAIDSYWQRIYDVPDQLAIGYADRYRSSYTLVALFATATVLLGLGGIVFERLALPFTALELLLLVGLIALVAINLRAQWQARWIGYRLLAELCRKQRAVAMLGWSLPLDDAARPHDAAIGHARDAWIGWYFRAVLRAAPLASGVLAGEALDGTRRTLIASLVDSQRAYHLKRAREAKLQARGLAGWGEMFALVTLVIVAVKLLLLITALATGEDLAEAIHHVAHGAGIAAVVFAIPSIGLLALRAYAELEMLSDSNTTMAATMGEAKERLAGLRATEAADGSLTLPPLASQDIAAAVFDIAIDMLVETNGWARLFRVKSVEAG